MSKDKTQTAVDFNNPEDIAAALAADAASKTLDATTGTKAPKAPAEKKPRIIKIAFTATKDIVAGEVVEFDYELPVASRGAIVGIALADMTDDELRIEYRNSNSVYYKTKKKPGSDVTKSKARYEACLAEMAKRGIQPTSRTPVVTDAASVAELILSGKINVDEIQALLNAAAAKTADVVPSTEVGSDI